MNNLAAGDFAFIGNGRLNCACGTNSFIGNGAANYIDSNANFSFIGNGGLHSIAFTAHNSFIGAGYYNRIMEGSGGSAIVMGDQNTIGSSLGPGYCRADSSFIGGGGFNCIDTGNTPGSESWFGFIGGGQDNMICAGACHSSIIGGQGNRVLHKWATVSGYNVTTNQDCAFFANNFVAQNMPALFGAPTGTLMYWDLSLGPLPTTGCVVFVA